MDQEMELEFLDPELMDQVDRLTSPSEEESVQRSRSSFSRDVAWDIGGPIQKNQLPGQSEDERVVRSRSPMPDKEPTLDSVDMDHKEKNLVYVAAMADEHFAKGNYEACRTACYAVVRGREVPGGYAATSEAVKARAHMYLADERVGPTRCLMRLYHATMAYDLWRYIINREATVSKYPVDKARAELEVAKDLKNKLAAELEAEGAANDEELADFIAARESIKAEQAEIEAQIAESETRPAEGEAQLAETEAIDPALLDT